ncbi:response regulator transcription factor [Zeimonas arvi]|uniref:Response regulator transcription factor n=1 Tax=Zeimonas arvi TaxID=2498847 RepID=A0A5C8P092_9BURK|nr:response regulator transcription factor [Zeimonas arvi]TXL67029.1 response regulator transcription factor [Zeimonas arvi]
MARILVVEDDPVIGANVCDFLQDRGHRCDWAPDGFVAMALAAREAPEAVVLDLNLPRLDGLTWCRRFREEIGSDAPVIMLTARDELEDKLAGFDAGADDYLVKPFQLPELAVRLAALLRRAQGRPSTESLRAGRLLVDRAGRRVQVDGTEVRLSPKPFRLIELLAERPDRIFGREELEQAIWGEEREQGDALRTLVAATRRAFAQAGCDFDPIRTLHGHGYRLAAD